MDSYGNFRFLFSSAMPRINVAGPKAQDLPSHTVCCGIHVDTCKKLNCTLARILLMVIWIYRLSRYQTTALTHIRINESQIRFLKHMVAEAICRPCLCVCPNVRSTIRRVPWFSIWWILLECGVARWREPWESRLGLLIGGYGFSVLTFLFWCEINFAQRPGFSG